MFAMVFHPGDFSKESRGKKSGAAPQIRKVHPLIGGRLKSEPVLQDHMWEECLRFSDKVATRRRPEIISALVAGPGILETRPVSAMGHFGEC